MKNILKFFYNIEIVEISEIENIFFVTTNSKKYALQKCDEYLDNIEEIYNLTLYLIQNKIKIYKIIKNKYNDIITNAEKNNYILLEIDDSYNQKISPNILYNYQYRIKKEFIDLMFKNLNVSDWKTLWTRKIDFFEERINELNKNFPLVKESSSFFIGMSENSISLINVMQKNNNSNNNNNLYLYLQHRRIDRKSKIYDFYNPLNLVFDTRIRDFCEWYKDYFLYDNNYKNKISLIDFIRINKLNEVEIKSIFVRMFFPTFYYDACEKIIMANELESNIKKIIDKIDDYEIMLQELSNLLNKYVEIPYVNWIF